MMERYLSGQDKNIFCPSSASVCAIDATTKLHDVIEKSDRRLMMVLAELTICLVARYRIVCYAARSFILLKNPTTIWRKVELYNF